MQQTTINILLAGVGGQGILRASDILCAVAMYGGLDAKKSEVHGMAQRGGCVTSHVRFGPKVYSPLAKIGTVDFLVAFEALESLRYLTYLKPGGILLVSDEEINPPSVNLGESQYPTHIPEILKQNFTNVHSIPALKVAQEIGNIRTANTVLLGALSRHLPMVPEAWQKSLENAFPGKVLAVNLEAFHMGRLY